MVSAVEAAGDDLDPAHDRVHALAVVAQRRLTDREAAVRLGVEAGHDELVPRCLRVVVGQYADVDQPALTAGLERNGQFSAHRSLPLEVSSNSPTFAGFSVNLVAGA